MAGKSPTSGTDGQERSWAKVGVEMELLAPPGRSRRSLADAIASADGGATQRIFYPQSEYSRLDRAPIFENLTLGFDVRTSDGDLIARCVDDLTLVADLDPKAGAEAGWYRILSDDKRLLNLVQECCDPDLAMQDVLEPLARLFDVEPEASADGEFVKVSDKLGASVAMCAPLPGERHRPCELITPPLGGDRDNIIQDLLMTAAELQFTVPVEAATHIHFDGAMLQSSQVMTHLIAVLGHYRQSLRNLVGTNSNCVRLGDWPKKVYRTAAANSFAALHWPEAAAQLRQAQPLKYCDFNFINLLGAAPTKRTFEVRILPGSMDPVFISKSIRLFESILFACVDGCIDEYSKLPKFDTFLSELRLSTDDYAYWQDRLPAPSRDWRFGR